MSAPPRKTKQHGVEGAYVGGDWVEMEDCVDKFTLKDTATSTKNYKEKCGGDCAACPRSRSKFSSAKEDGSYDVIIIGAGCIGSAIARELSKTSNSVLLLEAADDVTQGATKGNSGIVHAGFDDTPGSQRAKFCWPGNQMFPELDKQLHFGYQKNGSLVLARDAEEIEHLKVLKARGETNGVKNLRIITDIKELFELEPYLNPNTIAALLAPDAGNLIPYEYAIAMAENAVDNGVELRIRRAVESIQRGSDDMFTVKARYFEPLEYVENALKKQEQTKKSKKTIDLITKFMGASILTIAILAGAILKFPRDVPVEFIRLVGMVLVAAGVLIPGFALVYMYATSSESVQPAELTEAFIAKTPLPVGKGGVEISVEDMKVGGTGSANVTNGQTVATETYRAKYIVNCGGCGSDKIAKMIGDDSFYIKPRLGDYILLNRNQGHLASHTLFPCPGPLGKGVLVQTTLWGNLILGPTARDTHLPEVMAETAADIQTFILAKCSQLVPTFDPQEVIHAFRGARAKSSRGDWIIEPSAKDAHFIHAAGIDSPGLAGSPAIAMEVTRLLKEAGLTMTPDPNFNPYREPIIQPKSGWKGLRGGKPGAPGVNIVCKCEKVTEEEIVTALHRSLPLDSTQALRKRTRAGMGHCQADVENYNCEARVAAIIARENNKRGIFSRADPQVPIEAVGRRPWPATSTLPQRWPTAEEKLKFKEYMEVAYTD